MDRIYKMLFEKKGSKNRVVSSELGALPKGMRPASPDENGITGIVIKMQGLDVRNGTRYLKILIENAFNIGALRGNDDIRVQRVSDVALIYPSRGGSPRWKGTVKSV